MKLRSKLLLLMGVPIVVLVLGICVFGRFLVKNAMLDIVENDLHAAVMYARDAMVSTEDENYYSFVDGKLYVNDFQINSPEQMAIFQEVSDNTGIGLAFFFGDKMVFNTLENGAGLNGITIDDESKSIVLSQGMPFYREDVDLGIGSNYYIYLVPIFGDGQSMPIGAVACATSETKVDEDVMSIVQKVIVIGLIFALVVIIIAALLIEFFTVKPMKRAVDALEHLAEGKLDIAFYNQDLMAKDEVGDIVRSLETLTNRLVDIIKDILILCGKVHSASGELSKQSDLSASHITQIDKAVNEIAQGATTQAEETQNTTDSIISIGDMISRSDEEIQNLNQNSKNMNEAGDEAIRILHELEDINKKTETAIDVIYEQTNTTNESASKIREAINLITDIAEETNLLSLNASIEAARAGEQGRGFAVVAGQISKLAEQSNESAKKIEDIVALLIEDSAKAVATMDDVRNIIGQQNEKIGQTGQKFQELKVGIENSVAAVGSIADNTRAMDDTRQGVVDSAQNLTSIAEENAASTEETSAAVSELNEVISDIAQDSVKLNDIANELHDQVNFFRLPSDTQATFEL